MQTWPTQGDQRAGAAGQGPAANQKGHVYKTQGTGSSCPAIVSGVLPQEKRGATNSFEQGGSIFWFRNVI